MISVREPVGVRTGPARILIRNRMTRFTKCSDRTSRDVQEFSFTPEKWSGRGGGEKRHPGPPSEGGPGWWIAPVCFESRDGFEAGGAVEWSAAAQ